MPAQDMTASADTNVFTVLFRIAGATEPDEYAERVYESRSLDDAMLGGPDPGGVFDLEFDRPGKSFPRAVLKAIAQVRAELPEAELLRVEPDDLVTVAAIAARVGRSHESVRLLSQGRRGPGDFPAPAGRIDEKTQVWRWSEVAQWFEEQMDVEVDGAPEAAFLAALNDVLELRRLGDEAIPGASIGKEMASLLPKRLATPA
jgi:hypothetical protein